MNKAARKILVIEDDALTRHFLLTSLQLVGFDTITAENGVVGIQQVKEQLPDLVICSIKLADIDAFDILNKLHQNPLTTTIPIIVLSERDSRQDMRRAMNLGADDYITKPYTIGELTRAINTQLHKQATLKYLWTIKFQASLKSISATNTSLSTASEFIFPDIPQLKEVFDFIEAHYHQAITLCDVAQAVDYSPAYLTNRVAKLTGKTVNSWIIQRRMAQARFLLQNTEQTAEEIASALGYQNVSHFSRQFRQNHNFPPLVWRKKHQVVASETTSSSSHLSHKNAHRIRVAV